MDMALVFYGVVLPCALWAGLLYLFWLGVTDEL